MKKILSLALLGLSISASAQHLPNGDFTNWKTACGKSYQSSTSSLTGKTPYGETQRPGIEPEGWNGSSVNQKVVMEKKEELVTQGSQDDNSWTVLTNKYVGISFMGKNIGSNAPAFINFGTPWVYAISDTDKCDGGVYGGMTFSSRPDAIKGRYKRTTGTEGEENAHIIAYLWKGTFTSNITATGTVSKDDVDRVVLGKETGTTSGTLIASCDYSFSSTAGNDWEEIIVPLNYVQGQEQTIPEKVNVIISSADYWTRSNIKAGNVLEVDDVEFVYRSQLNSIKYNNTPISGFNKNKYSYTLLGEWADGCLTSTSNGKGATQSGWSYNPATQTATNTITGEGEDENGETTHTYTVKFVNLSLASITYKEGTAEAQSLVATKDNHYYVFAADYSEGCLSAIPNSSTANVSVTLYNEETRVATLTVSEAGLTENYYVKFAKKDINEYSGKMFIDCEILGGVIGISSRGVNGVSSVEVSQKDGNNNVDFQLSDFDFEGPLGNIYVTNVPYNENGNIITLYKEQTITIFGEGGAGLGELPVVLNGTIQDGQLTATIDIDWSGIPIQVKIYPLNTSSMDLSEYTLTNTAEEITEDITNPNCLVYVKEGSEYSANNFVVGSTCENFTLTEGQAFDAPKAFTAKKVTYDRTLSAGKVQTFVLPFSFTPGKNDLVAALESVEGRVLTFKPIEGATEANKPYLIQTNNASALASFDNVTIEPTTGDLTTTVDGVSHIGSYAELTVTDAYGYAGGQFVQAGKGTVKPFRTYITIPAGSAAAPKAFDIHFADTETGIATVVTDSKDQNVYNLQGVRVAKSLNGLTKGIYIVNGKKTVIK